MMILVRKVNSWRQIFFYGCSRLAIDYEEDEYDASSKNGTEDYGMKSMSPTFFGDQTHSLSNL